MSPENLLTTLRWLLSENLLLQRLFFASVELAALALVVVLLIRLGRIRSPRLVCLLWLVVLIKPIVSLAVGSPIAVGLLDPAPPQTGRIDPEVARAWQEYDLRMLLEENWNALGPKLQGKLHIVVGERDTFYLESAVKRLAETLGKLGSNARIEIIPGKDHFNLPTSDCRRRFRRQMSETYLKHYLQEPTTVSGR